MMLDKSERSIALNLKDAYDVTATGVLKAIVVGVQ